MIDPADYSREFTDHCAEQIEMSELSPTTGDWCAHCGVGFILPSGLCDHCNANPCDKILDHKWLDPVCVEGGCQSLFLPNLDGRCKIAFANMWLVQKAVLTGSYPATDAMMFEYDRLCGRFFRGERTEELLAAINSWMVNA